MPFMLMDHAVDPKLKIKDEIGDLNSVEIFNNLVLVAFIFALRRRNLGLSCRT